MDDLRRATETAPVFAGLGPAQLSLITACARRELAQAGTFLVREGERAERFFLIEHGAVAVEIGSSARGPCVLGTLHDGDLLGWSWLFPPYRWRFDGRVTRPSSVIAFDGQRIRDACESDHELGYRLLRQFAAIAINRLQETRLQLLDVYANPSLR